MHEIFGFLRTAEDLFPVEVALTLGLICFVLSWLVPRRIVSLPTNGRRRATLTAVGVAGSLAVLAVATTTSALAYAEAIGDPTGYAGWWRRPAPLLTATLVIGAAALALRREPLPAPGERQISPRRHWWAFAPRPLLWMSVTVGFLLLATAGWQTLIGVTAPTDANRYGNVPGATDLPVYMSMQGGMGYIAGAGWPNHLATLLTLALAIIALALALGADANRPLYARSSAASVRQERESTARLLLLIVLGGVLLALGAVWAHVGFIGEIIVGMTPDPPGEGSSATAYIGTGYRDIARLMHLGGYLVQGVGAGLLLRLAVDTGRAAWALARRTRADGQDPDTVYAGVAAGRSAR